MNNGHLIDADPIFGVQHLSGSLKFEKRLIFISKVSAKLGGIQLC